MAVIEGKNAVLEALRSGRRLEEVLMAANVRSDPRLTEIMRLASVAAVPVRHVERGDLDELSVRGAHQGVVAHAESFRYADLDEVLAVLSDAPDALIVVADGITDPQNVGSMIRTCEAAAGAAFVLSKHRAAGIGPAAEKAAAGATGYLPIVQVTNIPKALGTLKDSGFWVTGTAGDAETELWDADLTGKTALVFGSEGKGMGRLVRERCDNVVRIPVFGHIRSLNVSAATAILVYEVTRQRREARRRETAG